MQQSKYDNDLIWYLNKNLRGDKKKLFDKMVSELTSNFTTETLTTHIF